MKFCTKCGSRLVVGMNFCSRCGTRVLETFEIGNIGHELGEQPEYLPPRRHRQGFARQRQVLTVVESPSAVTSSTARPLQEIIAEVESNGVSYQDLPEAAKRILSRKEHYVVRYKLLEEQEGEYGNPVEKLRIDPELISLLKYAKTDRLYKFQEEALRSILNGDNVVITAPTGNGKTLAFAVPIFDLIVRTKKNINQDALTTTKAVFIYPTKALARDQLRMLQRFIPSEIKIAIFDGDTPLADRERILDHPPDILISNFDTIDYHLRNKTQYSVLFRDIQFIVVDEIHTYLGAFGSHVYYILRRLQRVANNQVQLIGSSATIKNAKQFAEQLFNRSVPEIRCDRGRRGRIHFIMLYPSKISMTSMITNCVRMLLSSEMKTLVFANTHKNAEVINLALRNDGVRSEIHRAGLMVTQRHDSERSFRDGELKALVSTPTLELGIDIGDLDSVVSMITGITTLTQRMGRAGRKGQESIVVLALRSEDPISAFYKNHPDTYFTDINPAYVEPNNHFISRLELMAAAMDRAIDPSSEFFDQNKIIQELFENGLLVEKGRGRLLASSSAMNIVRKMSIRGIGETVSILDCTDDRNHKRIGERQLPMALRELFPNSVYLLGGRKYESIVLDLRSGVLLARVRQLPDKHPYKTEALRHDEPEIIRMLERRIVNGLETEYCDLTITEVIDGYVVKEIFSDKMVGPMHFLPNPLSYTYETKGLVFRAPRPVKLSASMMEKNSSMGEEVTIDDVLAGSYHALEHTLIESSDSLTGSGSSEIGGVSMSPSGAIFVYDGSPGGSGLTKLLFDRLEEAFQRTLTILKECRCESKNGCPMCTYSYQCGNNNNPLCKSGAIDSLEQIAKGASTKIDSKFTGEKALL